MASHHKHHMKAKHHRAKGGRVEFDDQGSNEMREVHEKKHGGAVHHMGKVHGHKGKHRIKKARGGGIGSDKSPFTSAARGEGTSAEHGKGGSSGGFQAAHGK